jgi:hypothetical protein
MPGKSTPDFSVGCSSLKQVSGPSRAGAGREPEGVPTLVQTREVATTDLTQACSSCLIAVHLRKLSPRSDSNRRPSDYESGPNLPTGPAQTHPGCSATGPIPSRPVLWCLVVTPGLPQRLPPPTSGDSMLASLRRSTIRSQSDAVLVLLAGLPRRASHPTGSVRPPGRHRGRGGHSGPGIHAK